MNIDGITLGMYIFQSIWIFVDIVAQKSQLDKNSEKFWTWLNSVKNMYKM